MSSTFTKYLIIMKQFSLLSTVLFVILNILLGVGIQDYEPYNVILSSSVLVGNLIIVLVLLNLRLKDAFKVSLCTLFPVMTVTEFVLAVLAPYSFYDNWFIISIMALLSLQIILLLVTTVISKNECRK